jgi:hypothetical protein
MAGRTPFERRPYTHTATRGRTARGQRPPGYRCHRIAEGTDGGFGRRRRFFGHPAATRNPDGRTPNDRRGASRSAWLSRQSRSRPSGCRCDRRGRSSCEPWRTCRRRRCLHGARHDTSLLRHHEGDRSAVRIRLPHSGIRAPSSIGIRGCHRRGTRSPRRSSWRTSMRHFPPWLIPIGTARSSSCRRAEPGEPAGHDTNRRPGPIERKRCGAGKAIHQRRTGGASGRSARPK